MFGVSSPSPDPDARNNESSAISDVVRSADLTVTKTVTPTPLVPGRNGTYTVTVNNAGPSDAEATFATDPLPEGLTVRSPGASSTQGSCVLLGRTASCDLGPISSGGQAVITIPVAVDPGFTAGSVLNSASVTSQTPDPDLNNNTGTDTTAVVALADLTLLKTGPADVIAGEPLSWTLLLVNAGPSVAQDVVVTDPIPAGITGTAVSSTHGSCAITAGGLTCDIGTLGPGDVARIQIFITGSVDPGFSGASIANTATVTSPTAEPNPDTQPDGRSSTATTAVGVSADLSVSKTPTTAAITPGGSAAWTITVLNNGPSTARTVTLTDQIPAALSGVTFTGAGGTALDCPGGVCALGDVLPGPDNAVAITVAGTLDPAFPDPTLTNAAAVQSPTPDPTPGNNDTTSAVSVITSADLVLTKTADRSDQNPAVPGEPITWTLRVVNNGPSVARAVRVNDQLPAVTDARVTSTAGSCDTQIVCDIGDLAPGLGSAVIITVTAIVPPNAQGPTLTNTATVTSDTPDPAPGDTTATVSTPLVGKADLAITKTGPVTAGTAINWSISVTNAGPSMARAVVMSDPPPTGVQNLQATTDVGTCTGGTCELGDIPPGTTVTITVTGTVGAGYTGPAVTNTAAVTSDTADPNGANNTATTRTTVLQSADLSITKTVTPDPAVPGSPLTFTLRVANSGPSTARTVTVLDSLPDGLTGATATPSSGTCAITDLTTLLCTADSLDPAGVLTVTIAATLAADVPAGTLSNAATVAAATSDPDLSNNGATLNVPTAPADLTVTKTAVENVVLPGGPVGWTVIVTNNGPGTARNTVLEDTLPDGTTLDSAELSGAPGSCSGAPVLLCNLGDIPAGTTITLAISATVAQSAQGTLTNAAAADSPDESAPDDNVAQASVTIVDATDVAVTKSVTGPAVVAGGTVTWSILVTNAGPAAAQDVVMTDPVPAGLGAVTVPAGCTLADTTVRCALGSIAAQAVVPLQITATVLPASRGTITNTATVQTSSLDQDPTNNVSSVSTPIGVNTGLTITKTADRQQARIGETVTYTVTVGNTGPSTAVATTVAEQLPAGALITGATTAQGTVDLATGVWTVGSLPPAQTVTLTLTITYDRAGTAVNTVSGISSESPTPVTATATVTILPDPVPPTPPGPVGLGQPVPGLPQPGTGLPNTGFAAERIGLLGISLVLLGVALLTLGRRRTWRGRGLRV